MPGQYVHELPAIAAGIDETCLPADDGMNTLKKIRLFQIRNPLIQFLLLCGV